MEKAVVFVDVQNIYYTVKQQFTCHFNYRIFLEKVSRNRQLLKSFAYATDKGDQKQAGFQNILVNIGFDVKLIPFIQRKDGSAKGDWDVGIALDMLEYAKKADTIILASGDGDFASVIKKIIAEDKVAVEVYGVKELTAFALIKAATRYYPIEDNMLLPIPKKHQINNPPINNN